MKSPAELARRWSAQWAVADHREQRLLSADAWPICLPIGRPTPSELTQQTDKVREHLRRWRAVTIGRVVWAVVPFRGGSEPVEVPIEWVLASPSEWAFACDDPDIRSEYERLGRLVSAADPSLHRSLVRLRHLLVDKPEAEIAKALQLAMALSPGCAQGRPLRALSTCGIDSKFFERHRSLLIQLLDVRFDGQAGERGLEVFLGALDEGEHWLLVAPLAPGLLPFEQLRVRARELTVAPLPGSHLLVVENERCLHQLPPLSSTVAVLGAGLNLGWLAAPWLAGKSLGYWGDMDTWGLVMLARARERQAHLTPLLMSRELFDAVSPTVAVVEGSPADPEPPQGLTAAEADLYRHLRALERGRVEQEFLAREQVLEAIEQWRATGST